MTKAHPSRSRVLPALWACPVLVTLATLALGACGGPGSPAAVASDDEWRALREPRPVPLDGAQRVTVSGVEFLGPYPWPRVGPVTAELGVAELAVAGLLRRRDVDFVERRRFSAAAEAERQGLPRRPGQPPAGISPSADLSARAVWIPLDDAQAAVDVRLTRLESGRVAGATRVMVPRGADPVQLARAIVDAILSTLDDLGVRPAWDDPLAETNADRPTRVSMEALRSFLMGLAAEEVWDWEGARRGYLSASRDPGFHEARTVLARAARLRLGGTLGES